MHPEIRSDSPGACPICGMALEPLAPTAEEGENHELQDMTRRFWIAVALTVPLLWSMAGEFVPAINPMRLFPHGVVSWAQLLFATPVVLWAGWPFFVRGWQSVVNSSLNMFTLIALGTGAAWLFSVAATVLSAAVGAQVPQEPAVPVRARLVLERQPVRAKLLLWPAVLQRPVPQDPLLAERPVLAALVEPLLSRRSFSAVTAGSTPSTRATYEPAPRST